jgi:GT2 family glycosyltransferase
MRFIKTVNLGVILARGEYVCLLNSDTEVARDFVQRNVEIMDADSSIGGLSCIIVDKDGNNWFTGGSLREGFPVNLRDDFRGIRAVDFVAGTAAFYRRGVFDRIGLFDENYIMYHEDVEFGLRMRAKTGYGACMFHEKLVVHYGVPSIPTGRIFYYGHRNNIMLLRKYSRRDLRRVLWLYSREAFSWLNGSLLRASPQSFSIAVNIVRGTLEGLVTRQSEL